MAGKYDVGPTPAQLAEAVAARPYAAPEVLAAWRGCGLARVAAMFDDARNAASAALRAGGQTTPPDEPEPTPAPVPHRAIVPGFWRVEGYDGLTEATRGGHVRVKAHTGEGLVVWGLSLWGPDGEPKTWAYRTHGVGLDKFLARYPASLWFPEVDATPATVSTCPWCGAAEEALDGPHARYACGTITHEDEPTAVRRGDACLATEPTPATEAPTAPSEPDEGAASPAGPGEAVRPRVGAWVETGFGWARFWRADWFAAQARALCAPLRYFAWHPEGLQSFSMGDAPTLDAAKAAADAALEAAGYVLEGGAHVDPGAPEALHHEVRAALLPLREALGCGPDESVAEMVAQARALRAAEAEGGGLRAEVARLTADLETVAADRDRYRAGYERVGAHAPGILLDRIAEALGVPDDWRDLADDVLETTAADWREQAKRHEDAATVARGEAAVLREALARLTEQAEAVGDVARVLRCEPGDVAGAAQAALEQAALARGEAAGLERALRVLAEVRRG